MPARVWAARRFAGTPVLAAMGSRLSAGPSRAAYETRGERPAGGPEPHRFGRFGVSSGRPPTGGGRPLATDLRRDFEALLGADLRSIRIRERPEVHEAGAAAWTHGEKVDFAPGLFAPRSSWGRALLGHELAHVLQQRAGRVAPAGSGEIQENPLLEAEADRAGERASGPARAGLLGVPAPRVAARAATSAAGSPRSPALAALQPMMRRASVAGLGGLARRGIGTGGDEWLRRGLAQEQERRVPLLPPPIPLLETPRELLLRSVSDPKLKDVVEQIYRKNAKVGDGSSMDALTHEKKTGQLLSPKGHGGKVIERRNQLIRMRKGSKLKPREQRAIVHLMKKMQDSLS